MASSELEDLTRRIPLVAYAASAGYKPCARERAAGLIFLEHPTTQDAIAVGRTRDGEWIYASLAECAPRPAHESPDAAQKRLRDGIARTQDKGTIVEFECHRLRLEGREELAPDAIRARLRGWLETSMQIPSRRRAEAPPGRAEADRERAIPDRMVEPPDPDVKRALNQRRYDWSPPPLNDQEVQVLDRLGRPAATTCPLDAALGRPPVAPTVAPAMARAPEPAPPLRSAASERDPSAMNRRHYDWTPLGGGRRSVGRGREPGR